MHPEQIKAEIRMKGTTLSAIAEDMKLSRMAVSNVIHNRITSRRIASHIAAVIGRPASDIWPGKYLHPAQALRRTAAGATEHLDKEAAGRRQAPLKTRESQEETGKSQENPMSQPHHLLPPVSTAGGEVP